MSDFSSSSSSSFLQYCRDGDLKSVNDYMAKKLCLSLTSLEYKQWAWKSWNPSNHQMINDGLRETVEKDYLQVFQFLLQCANPNKTITLDQLLKMAVEKRSWQIIYFILCYPEFIKTHKNSDYSLNILSLAVEYHQSEVEQHLLKQLNDHQGVVFVSSVRLEGARLQGAVKSDRLDIVENILILHPSLANHCLMFAVNWQKFSVLQKMYDMGLEEMKISYDHKDGFHLMYHKILFKPPMLEWFIKRNQIKISPIFKNILDFDEYKFYPIASCFFQFGTNDQKIALTYELADKSRRNHSLSSRKLTILKTISVALDYGCPLSDVSGLSDVQQLIRKRQFLQKLLIHCLQSTFDTFTTSQVICTHLSFFPNH